MGCGWYKNKEGAVFHVNMKNPPAPCEVCGGMSSRLCDGPPRSPETKPCDRHLCSVCAVRVGRNRGLCPECHKALLQGELFETEAQP